MDYKLFWTWDHSTNWCLNVRGAQNCGVGNLYTKEPEFFTLDYKRAIDWCAANGMSAIGAVGLLRDAHGGIDAAREVCGYARERGVRFYLIAGLFSYGGVYFEGDSPWTLERFFATHPDAVGRKPDGSPQIRHMPDRWGGRDIVSGCPSSPELNQYVLDSLDWVFKTIPELGGIQMEIGDVGICHCPRCRARRAAGDEADDSTDVSVPDMARIYADAADAIRGRSPDAWIICETYHHFLDKDCDFFRDPAPGPELRRLFAQPETLFWQWKCDRQLARGDWHGEPLPESLRKFRHVMRAHSGTQWWGGRHTLQVEKIRRQCFLSHKSGLQGVSIFGEGSPFHTNAEFNYLALVYFADRPEATLADFARDVMAEKLGGELQAEKYLEYGVLDREPEKIPAAVREIARIQQGMTDYDVLRRWQYLASFLNACCFESRQPGYHEHAEVRNLHLL